VDGPNHGIVNIAIAAEGLDRSIGSDAAGSRLSTMTFFAASFMVSFRVGFIGAGGVAPTIERQRGDRTARAFAAKTCASRRGPFTLGLASWCIQ
jgi:hypothetical protein